MSVWQPLDAELGEWRAAGLLATLWWRDDDAYTDSPALQRLLEIAEFTAIPVALATIPGPLDASLAALLRESKFPTIVQHGYAHRNYAPAGERKRELGPDRDIDTILAELRCGADILRQNFGARFAPVLVPPWNRIDSAISGRLPEIGVEGLSVLGPRPARCPVVGLVQCNVHVDLIAWRQERAFVGVEAAIDRLVGHLCSRRESRVDAFEATGVLTHHLDMSADAWHFLRELIARTRQHGAVWLDVAATFEPRADLGAHFRPISMKRV